MDLKVYSYVISSGCSWRRMQTSMCREDIMAPCSKWHRLAVPRWLSGCSWRRMQASIRREDIMATCSKQRWLRVTRQSAGCSWRRTQMSMCRVDFMAAHSRRHQMAVRRQLSSCSWRKTQMSMRREDMSSIKLCFILVHAPLKIRLTWMYETAPFWGGCKEGCWWSDYGCYLCEVGCSWG